MRQIQEERLLCIRSQERLRFARQAIREVLARFGFLQAGHVPTLILKRRKVAQWRTRVIARDVDVEALFFRPEAVPAKVPFADVRRRITGGFERLRKRDFVQR